MNQNKLEALRIKAVKKYLEGKNPQVICKELSMSKRWLFKWIKRYKTGKRNWFKEESKTPHTIYRKIPSKVEKKVIAIRRLLQETKISQIGAINIQYQMQTLEEKKIPQIWTINRILKRNNLVSKREKRYQPKGKPYPQFPSYPFKINTLHQFDIIGPRYLKGDGCFYAHNLMDIGSHGVVVNPKRSKVHKEVVVSLKESWEITGIPYFLQLDNQLSCRGSNRYPRSFGLVIRLCLLLGVEPIFIPLGEPWRNGCIEKFQDTFEHRFFRKIVFSDFKDLQNQAKRFERFHNQNHRYSCLKGQTPSEVLKNNKFSLRVFPDNFSWDSLKEKPESGYIHLIRFIRSNRILDIFGEKFRVNESLVYEYVRATIIVKEQKIKLFHQDNLVDEIDYGLPD
jgi:transposase-like protein